MENLKFNELPLSEEIRNAVSDMGFVEASPIQSQAIPFIMAGHDVIGQAQTGTGKTAAFGIPALEMVDAENKNVQALILCPTRELANQVTEEIKKLSKYKRGVHVVAIYGGESIDRQIKALKRGVHIVVGTPGRVMDHMERKTLKLDNVQMIVLDEADEMLDMGFREDIETILEEVPEERQTIFFSATMSAPIMSMTKRFQKNPKIVKVTRNELTGATIEQSYFEVKSRNKIEAMSRLIDAYDLKLMLVFCNMKVRVDEVVSDLQSKGYTAEGLHGDMKQMQRNTVMGKFRNGNISILVATDVAARGIDVDNVDAVFNFDIPLDSEYYVHRIGRTGRAGRSGKSLTFVTGRNEAQKLREIENYTKVKITKGTLPSGKDIFKLKAAKFKDKLKETLATPVDATFDEIVNELLAEGFDLKEVSKSLLKMQLGNPVTEREDMLAESSFSAPREGRERERERERGPRSSGSGDRDGGSRRESGPRERSSKDEVAQGKMVRLFINLGKDQKIRPGDIVGAIAGESGINGNVIGDISIYDKFSYVYVPKDNVNAVLEGMSNNTIKGKKVSIEVARN